MTELMVVKRNGEIVGFEQEKILNAILKAVRATNTKLDETQINDLVISIKEEIETRFDDFFPNVENIQDIVEKHLVKHGLYEIAKAYILYRARRQEAREFEKQDTLEKAKIGKLRVKKRDGSIVLFDLMKIQKTIQRAAMDLENDISSELITKEVVKNIYDGVTSEELERAIILATISFIEKDPAYSYLSARFFLQRLYKEVMHESITEETKGTTYRESFMKNIHLGVEKGVLDKRMLSFDLVKLANYLKLERDFLLEYLGIQTLYDRYFTQIDNKRTETPQAFWMRVSMGLALNEQRKEEAAMKFYDLLSTLRYIPSTPTLFHSGTAHPQLSSCYLTTVNDDLDHIFKCIADNAQMAKWSGGIGNDWSNIRGIGALIKTTGAGSQGVVPFLKIANDVTVISKTGKRRGGTCAYLENWHIDFEEFLNLRKNTGDERRRTHDMNTAAWIPDLFMKRVLNNEEWTLFSPNEVPDLHHLYGRAFEDKYKYYEEKARQGKIHNFKVISAAQLWRKMLSMLFETGHPWITFKDPCNIRSPQDHVGVVHSSNLCTEIILNTSENETAVCNLGSINLATHTINGKIDTTQLAETVKTAIRMLDNVIDLNFYPTKEGRESNMKHRPIGLGIMGFQDSLYKQNIAFDSEDALTVADELMEFISYYAILASSELAKERGPYSSFKGSKWDRGIFPIDSIEILETERGMPIEVNKTKRMDWNSLKKQVKLFGMRNSNTMAIAPTATISTISGCYPSIEAIYKNIYVKSNVSGEFTVVNSYLIEDLKKLGLWNQETLEQIKYHDGNLSMIASIPQEVKDKYKEAFEIDPVHCIKLTALRSKWIDQSQSHNVFMQGTSGKMLESIYTNAWKMGLKTTYYLRTLAKSQIEKSTLDAKKYGFTQKREYNSESENVKISNQIIKSQDDQEAPKICKILDPECESCQ